MRSWWYIISEREDDVRKSQFNVYIYQQKHMTNIFIKTRF